MGKRSRHICGTSHDNRRQTERDEACFNCRGAKEEKQSLKEPYAKESGTARGSVNSATGCEIIKVAKPHERVAREKKNPFMKSPLNIEETAARYCLNEAPELKEELTTFDQFIWQDCNIKTVEDLVAFEKQYQKLGKNLDFCFDSEVEEFSPVYMCDGEMCLLWKGAFQRTSKGNGELFQSLLLLV